ncbi:MAG: sigma-70 family RNA polymerase sigma factor [Nocardioides sp.]
MTTDADDARLEAARDGDLEALAGLFREHHRAALGYAISLAGPVRAPDVVSEAFVRISALMKAGRGPQEAFRPYLIRTIRSVHVDHVRRSGREIPVEDVHETVGEPTIDDGSDLRFERGAIVKAFSSLPERWQSVLWFTAVEGVPLTEVAERLGIQPNAVAALGFRAREGLRLAYLREHLGRTADPACLEASELLPRYVRGTLPARQSELVRSHLDRCEDCADTTRVLGLVNVDLAAALLPAVIGLKLWLSVAPGGPSALASALTTVPGTTLSGTAVSGTAATGAAVPGPVGAGAGAGAPVIADTGRRLLSPLQALTSAATLVIAGVAAVSGPAVSESGATRPLAADVPAVSVSEAPFGDLAVDATDTPITIRRKASPTQPVRKPPAAPASTAATLPPSPAGPSRSAGGRGGSDGRSGGHPSSPQLDHSTPGTGGGSGSGADRGHHDRGHHYGQDSHKPGHGGGHRRRGHGGERAQDGAAGHAASRGSDHGHGHHRGHRRR